MSLILAVEPDRRQAAQLTSIIQRRVRAELVLSDTTEGALGAIGSRVPDLVLVPALLSPQDDAALAAALRVIASAAHVQMLTIPVLAAPGSKGGGARGLLSALRRDKSDTATVGCDPAVFAEQITSYLKRAAEERAAAAANDALIAADEEETEAIFEPPAETAAEVTAYADAGWDPEPQTPTVSGDVWEPVVASEPLSAQVEDDAVPFVEETSTGWAVDEPADTPSYESAAQPEATYQVVSDAELDTAAEAFEAEQGAVDFSLAPAASEFDETDAPRSDPTLHAELTPADAALEEHFDPTLVEFPPVDAPLTEHMDVRVAIAPVQHAEPIDDEDAWQQLKEQRPELPTYEEADTPLVLALDNTQTSHAELPEEWNTLEVVDTPAVVDDPDDTEVVAPRYADAELSQSDLEDEWTTPEIISTPALPVVVDLPDVAEPHYIEAKVSLSDPPDEWNTPEIISIPTAPVVVDRPDVVAARYAEANVSLSDAADEWTALARETISVPATPAVVKRPAVVAASYVADRPKVVAPRHVEPVAPIIAPPSPAPIRPAVARPASPRLPAAAPLPASGPMRVSAPTPAPKAAAVRSGQPEWVELIESLRRDLDRLRVARGQAAASPVVTAAPVAPAVPTRAAAAPARRTEPASVATKPKRRRTEKSRAIQDEWGLFDPAQCGFSALLEKLDEVVGDPDDPPT